MNPILAAFVGQVASKALSGRQQSQPWQAPQLDTSGAQGQDRQPWQPPTPRLDTGSTRPSNMEGERLRGPGLPAVGARNADAMKAGAAAGVVEEPGALSMKDQFGQYIMQAFAGNMTDKLFGQRQQAPQWVPPRI